MYSLELRIPPLAVTLTVASAMTAIAFVVPADIQIPARLLTTFAFVLAGAGVGLTGVLAFRGRKTTVNSFTPERSSDLVTTGIYRLRA